MAVNITTDINTVKVTSTSTNTVKIVDSGNNTTVSVSQPTTRVITVATIGPQGPQGLIPSTGSFVTTSSFNAFTSSYNTGSFTGSFTGSLFGTSSYAASIGTLNQNVNITGSLNISGSITATGNQTTVGYLLIGSGSANNTPNYGAAPNVVVGMNTGTAGAVLELRNTSQSILAGTTLGTIQFTADGSGGVYSSTQIRSTVTTGPGSGASGGGNLLFLTAPSTSGGIVERMRITSTGDVGIGTTSPATKLEIKGATAENTTVRISNNGGAFEVPTLQFYRNASVNGSIFYYPDGGTSQGIHIRDSRTDVSNIIFETAGANERMRINSSGNVGIGTTTPTGKLSVLDTTLASGSANVGSLLDLQQTWNTTGTPSAIKLNVTNTNSNSNSRLIDLQIGGIPQFYVTSFSVYANRFSAPEFRAATDQTMTFGNATISTQTKYVDIATGQMQQTSGINSAVSISPIYNQVTSTAANTDLKVNRTETSVGSGTQLLMDLQVGGVSKFNVTTNGTATAYGGIYTSIISDAFSTNNSRINFGGSSKYIAFNTNNTEAVRVSSNQNLLLGTTTDSGFKLDVNGTSRHTGDTTITGSLLVTGSTTVAGNIVPVTDIAYDLGTTSKRFNNVRGFKSEFTYYYSPSSTESYFGSSTNSAINFPINNLVYGRFAATTGNLLLQNGGAIPAFSDNGYRLQIRASTGSLSGSLYTDGFVNFTGTISSSVAPTNNPSASLMVIGGTTIQSASILNSSAVQINPIMSASANSQTLIGLDINPTFNTTGYTGTTTAALRVNGPSFFTQLLRITGPVTSQDAYYGNDRIDVYGSSEYLIRTNSGGINLNSVGTGNINFRTGATVKSTFFNSTGNFALQNGGIFTDDGINRLQVSGSARITDGLTLSGSISTPLVISRNIAANSNIQYQNPAGSYYAGLTGVNSFGIGWNSANLTVTSQLSVFGTTGNVVIQNGGSPADDGINRLQVSGSARITDGLTLSGSLLVTGSTTVAGNIVPSVNGTYDLGAPSFNFTRVRAQNVVSNGSLSLYSGGNLGLTVASSANILIGTATDNSIDRLQVSGSAKITDGLTISGSLLVTGSTTVAGNIVPSTTATYDLGTTSIKFRDGWFSRNLHAGTTWTTNIAFETTNLTVYNSTGNQITGKWFGTTGNLSLQSGSATAPTDDGINRLQVSGSARITNGLTVTGSLLISSSAGMTVDGINIGRGGGYVSTNTAIGGGTLQANTTGNNNVIIGQNSGFANTLGNNNTYFGNGSGQNNLLWSNNSYFGNAAGQTLTTGGNNAFFGSLSGTKIADKSTNVTILSNSVMLGFRASPLGDNQTNQIVIGYDSTGLGGNTTVLGNTSTVTTAIYGDLLLGTTSDSGTEKLQVVGNTKILGQTTLSGSQNTASGSILKVIGSGSQQPIFTVLGSQGELFSITDSLSGSLFSVNDISGLPILEVFSDNTTLIGNYQAPALVTTAKNVLASAGAFTVYSLPTASYDGAFFEYTARSGSNARAGQIMAIWSGSVVNYTETTSSAFGTTTGLTLGVFITGSNMALTGSATTSAWTIKTIIRSI